MQVCPYLLDDTDTFNVVIGGKTMPLLFNSIKEYPKMIQIIIFKEPGKYACEALRGSTRREPPKDDYITLERSVRRSRAVIRDLVVCNEFELFATFTFSPKLYDRYNFNNLKLVMLRWLNNQRRAHSPGLQYLVIPELHKNGAIHFHALLKNYNGRLNPTGKISPKGKNVVFNLPSFRGGFTTCSKIDQNLDAVGEYVSKYITKDMISVFNKNRYFCSKYLLRPKKSYNKPIWLPRIKAAKKIYDTKYYETYVLENTLDNRKALMID